MASVTTASNLREIGIRSAILRYFARVYLFSVGFRVCEFVEDFSVTLIHALIHSGGVKGKDGVGTDLHYLGDKYDAIIDACQKNKPRVKRAGGN